MKKFFAVIIVILVVILVVAISLGLNVLIGAALVWLASKAFTGIEFSWALAAFVGVALYALQSIFKVTVTNKE